MDGQIMSKRLYRSTRFAREIYMTSNCVNIKPCHSRMVAGNVEFLRDLSTLN